MLRIHFTAADMIRIHLAMEPAPLVETLFSLELLMRRSGGAAFALWRDLVSGRIRAPLPMLRHLIDPSGLVPAFLGPTTTDLGRAWDEVGNAPPRLVRRALLYIERRRRVPRWGRALAEGDASVLGQLLDEYRTYHTAAIAPIWPEVTRRHKADLQVRTTTLAMHGAESLLHSISPVVSWHPPVLVCQLPDGPHRDLQLQGAGLRLMPSIFARLPHFTDDDGMPTIIYPVNGGDYSPLMFREKFEGKQLVDLIGRTRAVVLRTVARHNPVSTSELAIALDISLAAVSKHTTVLRANGLIASNRDNRRVIHMLTPLGEALLDKPVTG